ncbi:MAG: DUF445 domain-containing protein, partial [Fusobacteriaceae bacterium]
MLLKSVMIISIGALIGWATNFLAIKMLFKPRREINFLLFKLQGVIPKRKHEMGQKIAAVVKEQVISMSDILNSIDKQKLEQALGDMVDKALEGKVQEELKRNFPMLAMFLSDSVLEKIQNSIKNMVMRDKEEILSSLFLALEKNVNMEEIIVKNVDAFSLEELEKITLTLAKTEFRHIEVVGAILGA